MNVKVYKVCDNCVRDSQEFVFSSSERQPRPFVRLVPYYQGEHLLSANLFHFADSRGHSSGLQSREGRELISYDDI